MFTGTIEQITKDFYEEFKKPKLIIVTAEVNEAMVSETSCYVCNEPLDDNDRNRKRI